MLIIFTNLFKESVNSNVINGKNSRTKQKSEMQILTVSDNCSESALKKQKLGNSSSSGSDVNPLQRGKYGLRMLPQQVDYYQVEILIYTSFLTLIFLQKISIHFFNLSFFLKSFTFFDSLFFN